MEFDKLAVPSSDAPKRKRRSGWDAPATDALPAPVTQTLPTPIMRIPPVVPVAIPFNINSATDQMIAKQLAVAKAQALLTQQGHVATISSNPNPNPSSVSALVNSMSSTSSASKLDCRIYIG
jgi:hypothetical protein